MEIAHEFTVELPPERVYDLLLDFEQVVPCVPGAELGEQEQDDRYGLTVTVRLGPIRAVYDGTVHISERDERARRAVLVGSAREVRGQGSAQAEISMGVRESDGGSVVSTLAEIDLTGRAAQMGSGVVDDVAARMISDMASCLSARFGAPGEAPMAVAAPVRGGRLLLSILLERLRALLRRLR